MGLRARVSLILATATLVLLGLALGTRYVISLPQLIETESVADRLNVRRLELGVDMVRARIEEWIYDYAIWDDCYIFMHERNEDFVASNLLLKTLASPGLSGVWITDNNNRIVTRIEADLEKHELLATPRLDAADALSLLPTTVPEDGDPPVILTGIARTSAGALIYAAASIKKSNERGDSPGRMLVYRFIDERLFEQLRANLQIDFSAELLAGQSALQASDTARRDRDDRIFWVLRAGDGAALYRLGLQLAPSSIDTSPIPLGLGAVGALIVAIFAVIMLLLDRQVLRPVAGIAWHLQRIRSEHDYSLRLHSQGSDEIAALGRECDNLIEFVQEQQTQLAAQAQELRDLSNHDALTGLANRRLFDVLLHEYRNLALRHDTPLTLLLCDLDSFKNYNDRLGHPAGDAILTRFGAILRAAIIRQADVSCRYGGEEFALLLPNTSAAGGVEVAARIHATLKEANLPHPDSLAGPLLTVSIGVACFEPRLNPSLDAAELLARADKALYEAKAGGRNRTQTYDAI